MLGWIIHVDITLYQCELIIAVDFCVHDFNYVVYTPNDSAKISTKKRVRNSVTAILAHAVALLGMAVYSP